MVADRKNGAASAFRAVVKNVQPACPCPVSGLSHGKVDCVRGGWLREVGRKLRNAITSPFFKGRESRELRDLRALAVVAERDYRVARERKVKSAALHREWVLVQARLVCMIKRDGMGR